MEILMILETLEEVIEKAPGVPFSGKCMIDREEMFEIIKEIRLKLPDDIKQAKWVKEERQRILFEAEKEAARVIEDAEGERKHILDDIKNIVNSRVEDTEIVKKAYEQSEEIISVANRNAREIKLGTKDYADNILGRVEELLADTIEVIKTNRKELK